MLLLEVVKQLLLCRNGLKQMLLLEVVKQLLLFRKADAVA
jgi:hypothetical protein